MIFFSKKSNIDLLSANNYYPFGMLEPERSWTASKAHRYGYNGKERDDAIKGEGNSLDYGARMLDTKIARWGSRDALEAKYPGISTYAYCANNPLIFVDPNGKDLKVTNQKVFTDFEFFVNKLFDDDVKTTVDKTTGLVQIDLLKDMSNFSQSEQILLDYLINKIISNPKVNMTLNLIEKESEERATCFFDKYVGNLVDIYDYENIRREDYGNSMSQLSLFSHNIGEQYSKQILNKNAPKNTVGNDYPRDHNWVIGNLEKQVGGYDRTGLGSLERINNFEEKGVTQYAFPMKTEKGLKYTIFNCDYKTKTPNEAFSKYNDPLNSKEEKIQSKLNRPDPYIERE